jgi:hypothetical protein
VVSASFLALAVAIWTIRSSSDDFLPYTALWVFLLLIAFGISAYAGAGGRFNLCASAAGFFGALGSVNLLLKESLGYSAISGLASWLWLPLIIIYGVLAYGSGGYKSQRGTEGAARKVRRR